jgi:murein DD-endopeptidase MepM/ murein hydrolase activator NlpD
VTRATRICLVALALVASSWPLGALTAAPASSTPTTASSQSQLNNLSKKIAEASAEEYALIKKLDSANAKKADTARRIAELDQQLPAVQASFDQATQRLSVVDAELAVAEASLEEASAHLHQGKDALKQRAIDAYIGRPDATLMSVGAHVTTFRQYVALKQYLHAVIAAHVKIVDKYDDLQKSAAELQDTVARRRAEAKTQRDIVANKRTALSLARTTQERLRADAVTQAADAASLLKQVRSRRAEFQAKYNQLKAQSDAIARLLKSRQSGQGVAPSGHGVLSSPIPGAVISSGFGPRVHPIFGDVRMHTGVDFEAAEGTPIHAAADGVVVSAGVQGGYGNATIIDHGNSLATLYAHQSRMIVSAGQSVKRGQVIGYVGHTGYATGPHLHFEVRVNGTPVDPMPYF